MSCLFFMTISSTETCKWLMPASPLGQLLAMWASFIFYTSTLLLLSQGRFGPPNMTLPADVPKVAVTPSQKGNLCHNLWGKKGGHDIYTTVRVRTYMACRVNIHCFKLMGAVFPKLDLVLRIELEKHRPSALS